MILLGVLVGVTYRYGRVPGQAATVATAPSTKPQAPPDIEKFRDDYLAGLNALQRKDPQEAVKRLSSFDFGSRDVEQYRLYYLASALKESGNAAEARRTLARLWRREPKMVHADAAGLELAALHARNGSWRSAAAIYDEVADRTVSPVSVGTGRWNSIETRFVAGDVGGLLRAARQLAVNAPRDANAADAIAIVRSLSGVDQSAPAPLTDVERLDRALALTRDGDPATALAELNALSPSAPSAMRHAIDLNRGLALHRLRRFEESNKVLEPLTGTYYRYAIPALYHAAKNYRIVAAGIDPNVTKVVREKKRAGSVKVRVGKGKKSRLVTKPRYKTVSRTVKLVDLARKEKKEQYGRLSSERLRDLLQLPLADPVRFEVLNTLIEVAQSKKQDDYVRELVAQVVRLDRHADPALQYFWDKAWSSYTRGDLAAARPLFRFIADTYTNANIRRQSDYWYARTVERQGETEEAKTVYRRLASAPYDDLYALHSRSRLGGAEIARAPRTQPVVWRELAAKEIPPELRLAYELTALSAFRDARLEIQRNVNHANSRLAEALLADFYNSTGNEYLTYRSMKRAFPQLATVDQDSAPDYFLRMYYPVEKYDGQIRKYAKRNGLDPNLVKGLILQESYFNPVAKSPVGATGLMQIMPPTGRELAGRLRLPFTTPRLEDPEVNVQLGTLHLRRLIDMFGGNVHFAVASYNAGQGNVSKWRRASPRKPLDEFLESIPFAETRNYVKRVAMLRSSFERLHTQPPVRASVVEPQRAGARDAD